ncbi:hypothetical protein [Amycolatopsis sp. NBC_00438]|uniref:hypothetical protein n=1 Tax=Amycolatopsis sp. NBC_00438 TaxID=2903558 RepID=UPI002E24BF7A
MTVAVVAGVQDQPVCSQPEQILRQAFDAPLPSGFFGLGRALGEVEPSGDRQRRDPVDEHPAARFLLLLEVQLTRAAKQKRGQRAPGRRQVGGLHNGRTQQITATACGFVDEGVHRHRIIMARRSCVPRSGGYFR